jgi:phosphohistidine swiveling domain-containing protein
MTSIFSTKAGTLQALHRRLENSLICDCFVFTVAQWQSSAHELQEQIANQFSPSRIIVRSSALREDGDNASMAGAYSSIKNVDSASSGEIAAAVNSVIKSYGDDGQIDNEILVQPMIADVSMSGVVFSHDLNTGAPYYVVNYDDETGLTDTVTSGTTDTSRTLLIHRAHVERLKSPRFRALIRSVQEIEALAQPAAVDLEFAVTVEEKIYIFQARRMAVSQNWNRDIARHIDSSLKQIQGLLERRLKPLPGILGNTTLFGEMPDWNPAEMIGAVPRPLAKSLYECLITNSIWAQARAEMGYRDLTGRPLMVSLGGRVYIDIRESFNSFLPAELSDEIGEKLVNVWLERLREHPELHDKIEFDVAVTAFSLDFDERVASARAALSEGEVLVFRKSLCDLTNSIILEQAGEDALQRRRIEELDERRRKLLSEVNRCDKLQTVNDLLRECARNGTRPFAIMARRGFIAESLLRSLESTGVLDAAQVSAFRASVPTVLTEFLGAMQRCQRGQADWKEFMAVYGHLRPGTYDILATRYDQHEEMQSVTGAGATHEACARKEFAPGKPVTEEIDRALAAAGFDFDSEVMFRFMRNAIAGREYAKLIFTRSVSDVLELIASWGIENGLSRDELSFLPIGQIIEATNHSWHDSIEDRYRQIASDARQAYEVSQALRLPYLISSMSDIYVVPLLKSRANFVTTSRVQAPLHYLSDHVIQSPRCSGKVVLIERADPGYDWIFLSPIAGLVTKYGGSNSHMAIRCAELGVPAAIGCGEQAFEQLRNAQSVLLDCAAGILAPVG